MDCMTRRQFVSGVPALGAAALHPAAANAQAPRPEADRSTLEKIIATAIAQAPGSGDTGTAVAVVSDGQLAYSGGFGIRDRDTGARVDAETFFPIGSAVKSFTSMAISMLVEGGAVELDAPIRRYLPDFKLKDPQAADATLEDVLSHRTGLRRHDALWYLGPFSTEQILHRVQHLNPGGAFRQSFEYNNLLVSVAGLVIKAKSGMDWEVFVRSRILEPLGMRSCSFAIADLPAHQNYAKGYNESIKVTPKGMENIRPAGELNCSVIELAKWIMLHVNRGVLPGGSQLIPPAALDRMYASHNPPNGPEGVGLGWFLHNLGGQRLVLHAGNAEGYTAFVSFMPDARRAVIVLTNQHNSRLPTKVAGAVYRHLATSEPLIRSEFLLAGPMLPGQVRTTAKALGLRRSLPAGAYSGMYFDAGYGDMSVTQLGDELVLGYYPHVWPLEATPQPDRFAFEIQAYGGLPRDAYVVFNRNTNGIIEGLSVPFDIVDQDVRLVTFTKQRGT